MTSVDHDRRRDGAASPERRRFSYRPGLDGVRALAVTAVIAYHMAPGAVPGGFFGVDVFFVVSGYLITTMLAGEWRERNRIALVAFWGRRVRRLYPGLVAVVVAAVLVAAVVAPEAAVSTRTTLPAALVYLTNWWFIFHHVPYFQATDRPPLLLHFWSLAIEEQYYLLWPPVLVLALRRAVAPARIARWLLVGAMASSVAMAVLYHPGAIDRIYYGSDTHAQGLLLGSALGLVVPPARLGGPVTARARRAIDGAGLAALVGIGIAVFAISESGAVAWRGGLAVVVVLAGVLVVAAVHPASRLSVLLAREPLRWIGLRSYSLYLWHWPVIDLTRPHQDIALDGVPLALLRLALILGLSEASYRLVEAPWRSGAAQHWLHRRQPRERRILAGGGAALAVVTLVVVATVSAPRPPGALALGATPAARQPGAALGAGSGAPLPGPVATRRPGGPVDRPAGLLVAPPGGPVLAIGDSVMLAASTDLQLAFGAAVTVDAAIGRQPGAGIARLAAYRSAGRLLGLRALVVDLGSNGVFTSDDLATLVSLARGVPHVILVSVRVPEPWQAQSNATIDSAASLPGYSVVDWYRVARHRRLLYADGLHPDPAGQVAYTNLVVRAVERG